MNIASVFRFLAYIMLFVALILLVPVALAVYYGEPESLEAFLLTMAIMLAFSICYADVGDHDSVRGSSHLLHRFDEELCSLLFRDNVRIHDNRGDCDA